MNFENKVKPYLYNHYKSYFEQIVETKDTVCYSYFVNKFIDIKSLIFITGVGGSGKTTIVENTLRLLNDLCDIKFSFSSQTTCNSIQENIENKLS